MPDSYSDPQRPIDLRSRAEAAVGALPALVLSAERLAAMIAPGAHGLRRAGPGEDFWQFRPAHAGDTARSIDWRRSARSDAAFVRDREAQTAQSVSIWVSAGRGMDHAGAPGRPTKADRARLLAVALSVLLLRGGEKVALWGDVPRAGRGQAERIAERLLAAPAAATDADAPGFEPLRGGRRLVLIGDFLGDPAPHLALIARASGQGLRGAALQVLDPDEESFPFAGAVLFRSVSGAIRHDTRAAEGLREDYLAALSARRAVLRDGCARAGWQFGHHVTDQPPAQALLWLSQALGGA